MVVVQSFKTYFQVKRRKQNLKLAETLRKRIIIKKCRRRKYKNTFREQKGKTFSEILLFREKV